MAPGSTPKPVTSTGPDSAIVIDFAPPGPFVEFGEVLPQPLPSDESIAPDGPQPSPERSGAEALWIDAPRAVEAQSRWSGAFSVSPVPPTATRSVKTEYGAMNTLAVELRDRSIVAYVNGRPVATAELGAEAAGTLGFYVDQRGMEVVFSRLRVVELAPLQ